MRMQKCRLLIDPCTVGWLSLSWFLGFLMGKDFSIKITLTMWNHKCAMTLWGVEIFTFWILLVTVLELEWKLPKEAQLIWCSYSHRTPFWGQQNISFTAGWTACVLVQLSSILFSYMWNPFSLTPPPTKSYPKCPFRSTSL